MYIPKVYKNENVDEIISFIKQNNFGILVTQNASFKTIATHIPFVISKKDNTIILTSHISKANEQWKNFESLNQVLVIFSGEHAYISSSWYDHNNVPTWNYIAAHLYGKIKVMNQESTLKHLCELVQQHEAKEENPTSVHAMGAEYIAAEMKGLVAFQIEIQEMYSAFKLSQNRDEKNWKRILQALEKRGDENSKAIATAMQKQKIVHNGNENKNN